MSSQTKRDAQCATIFRLLGLQLCCSVSTVAFEGVSHVAVQGVSRFRGSGSSAVAGSVSFGDHLIPGLAELGGGDSTLKVARYAGAMPPPITRNHMGKYHVCQPWEDCSGVAEVDNVTEPSSQPVLNVSSDEHLVRPKRACPKWGPTRQGCECVDSCECGRKPRCRTQDVTWLSDDGKNVSMACGDINSAGEHTDLCAVAEEPKPRPVMPEPQVAKRSKNVSSRWREFDAYKNKRFLPKFSCFSRDYYCATFPRFYACNPYITYRFDEGAQAQVKKCKGIADKKLCLAAEDCGTGAEKTCHASCIWTEDAPEWFRQLRGRQNQYLRRTEQDPASSGNIKYLPVLQPAYQGGLHHQPSDREDVIIKKPTEKAGIITTTAAPEFVKAGEVGSGRSAGFVRPSQVGKSVGTDALDAVSSDSVTTITR